MAEAAAPAVGSGAEAGGGASGPEASALAVRESGGLSDEGQVGDKYRVHLQIVGKYRTVTWEKLPEAPDLGSVPASSYSVVSNWNGWTFERMDRDGDSWHLEVLLLRSGGEFQVVRNEDWGQVICPERPQASESDRGLGPDDGSYSQGLNWSLEGCSAGDVVRISLKRSEADPDTWDVSWELSRKEELSEEQLVESRRLRLGVAGSWSDYARQNQLDYEGQDELRSNFGFYVTVGSEGVASFQLLQDLDWNRLVHPDRCVEGSNIGHRIMESVNDGAAMDLVWAVGAGFDQAQPGETFHVVVSTANGRVLRVTWKTVTPAELEKAVAEGRKVLRREEP